MFNITLTLPELNQVIQINWLVVSKDIVVILLFALSVLTNIFILRKDKIFALLFSIYVSYLIILFFPYNLWLSNLSLAQMDLVKIGGFISIIIILFFILSHNIFPLPASGIFNKLLKSIIFGILNMGLFLSLLSTLLPLKFVNQFSGLAQNILTGEISRFIWLTTPFLIIFLSFIKTRKKRPGRPAGE